jgi:hypothetical protein
MGGRMPRRHSKQREKKGWASRRIYDLSRVGWQDLSGVDAKIYLNIESRRMPARRAIRVGLKWLTRLTEPLVLACATGVPAR